MFIKKLLIVLILYSLLYFIALEYSLFTTPTQPVPQVAIRIGSVSETVKVGFNRSFLLNYNKNSSNGYELELSTDDSSYFQLAGDDNKNSSEKTLFAKRWPNGFDSPFVHRTETIRIQTALNYKFVVSYTTSGRSLFKYFRSHHQALEEFLMEVVKQSASTSLFVVYDDVKTEENTAVRCGFTFMKLQIKDKDIKIEFKHFCM